MYLFRKDLQQINAPEISVPKAERMMCLNESCLNPYQIMKNNFTEILGRAPQNRYLSDVSSELRVSLADYAGVRPENTLFGNGADDIIYHIFVAVRETQESFAVSVAPSYFDYKTFAREVGLGIRFLSLNNEFGFDPEEYLHLARDPQCKLAILCNPNNPTGNLFDPDALRYIIRSLPDTPVLLDETYYEFSGVSMVEELAQYPNLILVRSFSKAFAAAGLRFGYAISSVDNIAQLRKVQSTFHTSLLVQAFALAILQRRDYFLSMVKETVSLKDKLYLWLKAIPELQVQNSSTNFLSFSMGERSAELFKYLLQNGIALRDVGAHPLLKDYLRVTISCEEDVEAFKDILSEFLNKA